MEEWVRILAFDPGTASTGYGCIQGNIRTLEAKVITDFCGVIKTSITDGDVRKRIDDIGKEFKLLIEMTKPSHVVIEDFTEQGKQTGKTYKEMSWLIEHLRMAGREVGHEITIYENAEWKRIATGSKGLNKDQVKHFVSHKLKGTEGFKKRTATHVWDACGIAYAKLKELQGVK